MYLLVPVVQYNKITEKEEDIILSLIDLTPASIISIDEVKEDREEDIKAGVLINYKNGDDKKLRLPFLEFLDLLNTNGLVNFGMVQHCVNYNEELYKRVEAGKAIILQNKMNPENQYYKE